MTPWRLTAASQAHGRNKSIPTATTMFRPARARVAGDRSSASGKAGRASSRSREPASPHKVAWTISSNAMMVTPRGRRELIDGGCWPFTPRGYRKPTRTGSVLSDIPYDPSRPPLQRRHHRGAVHSLLRDFEGRVRRCGETMLSAVAHEHLFFRAHAPTAGQSCAG